MPKIGMRMIKSSVAVFLCFAIYLIRGDGAPFYSAIAAVLCMQPYVSNSRTVARNRVIGTFIGGITGMLVMMFENRFIPPNLPILKYLLIAAMLIPLIYTTVLAKKPSASYITCVVFMSITVSHALDANPFLFAMNRIIDTLIGIFVSLGVNAFHLPRKKNQHILFVSALGNTLCGTDGTISSYSKIKLNQLAEKGAMVTVASSLSPASIIPVLSGIRLRLPIITMNGAALYDLKRKTYLSCKIIPYPAVQAVLGVFQKYGLNCFVHTIINDILHIYYSDFTNPVEEKFYHANKLQPLRNYIYSSVPNRRDVVYFMAVDTKEKVVQLYCDLQRLDCSSQITTVYYPDTQNEGYYFLETYSVEASKENAVIELKNQFSLPKVAAFGNDESDLAMVAAADYGYAVENAQEKLRETARNVIGGSDSDAVVKTIQKLFHSKKL
jgi:hydroxymethylpyrimidine pyrophosphatase-like HAD family hydrolase